MTDLHSNFYFLYWIKPTAWLLAFPYLDHLIQTGLQAAPMSKNAPLNAALPLNWLSQPGTVQTVNHITSKRSGLPKDLLRVAAVVHLVHTHLVHSHIGQFQADTESGCLHRADQAVAEVVHSHSADRMVDFAVAVCMAAIAALAIEAMAT
jgi:hypothetical protein